MTFLGVIALCWFLLYCAVRFIDRQSARRLSGYLRSRNVSIYPVCITVHTSRFNSTLENVAKRHRRLLSHWFSFGVGFGLIGLVVSLVVLSSHILAALDIDIHANIPKITITFPNRLKVDQKHNISTREGHVLFNIPKPAAKLVDQGRKLKESGKAKLYTVRNWRMKSRSRKRAKLRGFHERAKIAAGEGGGDDSGDDFDDAPSRSSSIEQDSSYQAPSSSRSNGASSHPQMHIHTSARFVVTHAPGERDMSVKDKMWSRTSATRSARITGRKAPSLHANANGGMLIAPLLPGVTIPAFHVVYLAISILVAAAVHELGHALAAAAYDAQVAQVGGFFAFVFPGAFVQLEGVEKLNPLAQLKVWCAGAWHNFVSAILALILLTALPQLCIIPFSPRAGAIVVSLPQQSPLRTVLHPGDVITHLGKYKVRDGGTSFRTALENLAASNYSTGLCVSGDSFRQYAQHENRCCDGKTPISRSHLQCFHVAETPRRKTCIPDDVAAAFGTCTNSPDCRQDLKKVDIRPSVRRLQGRSAGTDTTNSPDGGELGRETCFKAEFEDERRLIDIHIRSVHSGARHRIIYEGNPEILRGAMSVSSYVPRLWGVMPANMVKWVARIDAPNHIHRLLQYFASVSLAIALLNLAPVYRLDGEHTAMLFIKMAAPNMRKNRSNVVRKTLVRTGTGLLLINLGVAFAQFRNA